MTADWIVGENTLGETRSQGLERVKSYMTEMNGRCAGRKLTPNMDDSI